MDKAFRKKIVELFDYRLLPTLMKVGNQGIFDDEYYEQLIDLQYKIYLFDEVLESDWIINQIRIKETWDDIYDQLNHIGLDPSLHDEYCSYLYTYQKHEEEIRDGKLPLEYAMEYFYYYKSCDVKLIRRLIYDRYSSLHDIVTLDGWKVFDLVTEVNDDVEDLLEDTSTINGNRYLISMLHDGEEVTKSVFLDFLDQLAVSNAAIKESSLSHQAYTSSEIIRTKQIIESQVLDTAAMDTMRASRIGIYL